MITIQELLYNRGLPRDARVKMVRHKDGRVDLHDLYRKDRNTFLAYQSSQNNPVFHDVDYIVSFVGEDNSNARFIGVYRVNGSLERTAPLDLIHYPTANPMLLTRYVYPMEEEPGYEDLKERVIVRWCNPIAWHQWLCNEMEVVELSQGLHYRRFTDYLDFVLTFDELSEIVVNRYDDWHRALSNINGVYLICDNSTGLLYVGSAYGTDGVWGRWSEYVATGGHGGNRALQDLLAVDDEYSRRNFLFSLLMLLPKSVTPEEAIRKEQIFKRKLGSRSCGLNGN